MRDKSNYLGYQKELERQHRDWMSVTGSTVNQLNRVNGFKGRATGELIRPKLIERNDIEGETRRETSR